MKNLNLFATFLLTLSIQSCDHIKEISRLTIHEGTSKELKFTLAHNYYIYNTYENRHLHSLLITNAVEFDQYFGDASTMAENGLPTDIDFAKNNVIACIDSIVNYEQEIIVQNLKKNGEKYIIELQEKRGNPISFSYRNFCLIVVDKTVNGPFEINLTTQDK